MTRTRPLLIVAALLALATVARADPSYDDLVGKAADAADHKHWAECARLYDQALGAFPKDGSRPDTEKTRLGQNRDRCQAKKPPPPPPARVELNKLSTNVPKLIGRTNELKQLDEAWAGPRRKQIVAVIAMGGQGKTTLVVNWLLRMQAAGYRGARQVFAWPFSSQGSTDGRAASVDVFLAAALKFFGDPKPDEGNAFDKAGRLHGLMRQQRSLLILDGLEPLQFPPGASQGEGVLRDGAMAKLLRDLAADHPGLVVVTSRVKLGDLEAFEDKALRTIELHPFSASEGSELLRSKGVQGTDAELAEAVGEARGLPLTLALLGNLLRQAYGGDVRKRAQVASLAPGDEKGVQAQHVMDAYDRWFPGGAERAVLRLLGLFDRPAPGGALKALRAGPKVPGLNEALVDLSDGAWNQVLSRLRDAGLVEKENGADPGGADAHPLVREHFAEVLKKENAGAWREGHGRLYAWYAASAKKLPDTAEEMAPLYAAVWHGCRAGRYQEALHQVFYKRIQRKDKYYSESKLGAFGADLSALSGFFTTPWKQPVVALSEPDRAWVLNEASVALRALGRPAEAVEPMRAGLNADLTRQDWGNAAISAANLSELQVALGQLKEAEALARQSVELADRSQDALRQMANRTTLANALHQRGQMEEALRLFGEAEAMQQKPSPLLYAVPGYQYCDLLLSQGKAGEVLQRAKQTLEWANWVSVPLDIGLNHLLLGRAHAARLAAGHADSKKPAREHLDQAVARLRESGDQQYIILGLLHRAAFFRQVHDYASARRDLDDALLLAGCLRCAGAALPASRRDLDEALLLADRGPMLLHQTDIHLERARLWLAQKHLPQARTELALAQRLIDQTGYARRAPEAEQLARQLSRP